MTHRIGARRGTAMLVVLLGIPVAAAAQHRAHIRGNSFLVEEAWNQGAGVVQHVGSFSKAKGGWGFAFTQEWPVRGMRNQVSYTVPVANPNHDAGVGDVAVNYRYQALGISGGRTAIAPRLSVSFPTGNEAKGLGSGGTGVDVGVPVSVDVNDHFTVNANGEYTYVRNAKDGSGASSNTRSRGYGAGVIWHGSSTFNVMLEAVRGSDEVVTGFGSTTRIRYMFVSPGATKAFNLASGKQLVMGLAFARAYRDIKGSDNVILYCSMEHVFSR